jgi:hypothetical protein
LGALVFWDDAVLAKLCQAGPSLGIGFGALGQNLKRLSLNFGLQRLHFFRCWRWSLFHPSNIVVRPNQRHARFRFNSKEARPTFALGGLRTLPSAA